MAAPAPEPVLDASVADDAADGASAADDGAAPPRCPSFTTFGTSSSTWRPVTSMNGMSDAELRACFGEPIETKGSVRSFWFPKGCSDRRIELELTLGGAGVTRARSRQVQTGQHCEPW